MTKEDLKDFLFETLNEHDSLFSDLSLDDETDTIFIKSVDGENFIVTVSPVTADEALIELWAKKNPELMSLALGVLNMRDLGGFTEEETDQLFIRYQQKNGLHGQVTREGLKNWYDGYSPEMGPSVCSPVWRAVA
mgnify:CR=1 FL=1